MGASGSSVSITVNGEPHTSGTAATWNPGKNEVEITVEAGSSLKTYTVTVTKEE